MSGLPEIGDEDKIERQQEAERMLDTSSRNCVMPEDCEGWKQPGFPFCPGDCPRRMSILTIDSPEEVKEVRDIWEFTWEMLLLPEWTELEASTVVKLTREWMQSGRDENWYADECISMLSKRLLRRHSKV